MLRKHSIAAAAALQKCFL